MYGPSVFILGASITKTSTERVVVLNAVAHRVIESRRSMHAERVFTYRGRPVGKLHSSAWRRAWKACSECSGDVRMIACIEDPVVISKILTYLDDKVTPVKTAQLPQCRAPPATGYLTEMTNPPNHLLAVLDLGAAYRFSPPTQELA